MVSSIQEIKSKVQEKLNSSHKEIVLNVFSFLIKDHNDFCGCNYCKILKDYVRLKVYMTKRTRHLNQLEFYHISDEIKALTEYRSIENEIKKLKAEKDKLKIT